MEFSLSETIGLSLLVLIIAALYSSVGHGGASGYLALLSFFAVSSQEMSTTALILNLLVAGIAFIYYIRAGHFSMSLAFPFLIASVPMAFIGGMNPVSERLYFLLLAVVLTFTAVRMLTYRSGQVKETDLKPPSLPVTLMSASSIGWLSGVVGVGGGIFLSPLMILLRWADTKKTSAVSACFILANSMAGLGGRILNGRFVFGDLGFLLIAGFIGGLIGSYYGANRFSGLTLRKILGLVLIIAAFKLATKFLW